ncbi:MAG: hypothetical protein L0Y61_00230 [Epsilonproteobacteria bacterium]|nr:hypothetical protein [Campylobacterota bacterium]
MDTGTQLVSSSILVHIYAVYALVVIIGINYYTVQKEENFFILANRLKKITPYFHSTNFIIAYAGAVLSGFTHDMNPTVILMIPTSLFLMITEIKRYKKMRVIQLSDVQLQEEFKIFAKKIYTMQVVSIVVVYIVSKLF